MYRFNTIESMKRKRNNKILDLNISRQFKCTNIVSVLFHVRAISSTNRVYVIAIALHQHCMLCTVHTCTMYSCTLDRIGFVQVSNIYVYRLLCWFDKKPKLIRGYISGIVSMLVCFEQFKLGAYELPQRPFDIRFCGVIIINYDTKINVNTIHMQKNRHKKNK